MKPITVTLYVSPEAAVRARKAQCGDVQFTFTDADLASLTDDQTDTLSRHLAGRQIGDPERPGWADKLSDHAPLIDHVDLGVVADLLDTRRAKIQAKLDEEERVKTERRLAKNKEIVEALAMKPTTTTLWLHEDGSLSGYGPGLARLEVPQDPYCYGYDHADEEHRAMYLAACEKAKAERAAIAAAVLPAALEAAAEAKAEKDVADAKAAIEYADLLTRLPTELRERRDAGYATDEDIFKGIANVMRTDAGYELGAGVSFAKGEESDHCTDAEFATFKAIKASAPEGAEVTIRDVWDYREAESDDDPDNIDEDGDVEFNHRRVVRVVWSRGGVEARKFFPL